MSDAICAVCPHKCEIAEGARGMCGARANIEGKIISLTYGKISALALDPVEKKPLRHFHPGGLILSAGAVGCNMYCPFCQNHQIAHDCEGAQYQEAPPEMLIEAALRFKSRGNIGIAFTYNEPLIGYEYVYDCAKLARQSGLKTVLVTNGMINERPLMALLPYIDAMNIDLKGFTVEFYDKLRGDLHTVKRTIEISQANCHIEVTTLIIPGENDSAEQMDKQAAWLASLRDDIPLHLSRFFPRYIYSNRTMTPIETLSKLAEIARRHLKYVYLGNV